MREWHEVSPKDTGCELHPGGCLSCSLEECRYDAGGIVQVRRRMRVKAMSQALGEGATRVEVCERFDISKRTYYRDKALIVGGV